MVIKYQVAFIGSKHPFEGDILATLYRHLKELGIDRGHLIEINETNFTNEYKGNAPLYCLYFGNPNGGFTNLDILNQLIKDASLILPIVDDLKTFKESTPDQLHHINGFELFSKESIESLVSLILEGLGLLRLSRRMFISYRREESSGVAIQLYEQLEKSGFDVYLDTHSVRPGEPFQDELWHRMADSDIVILLNTPGFLTGFWTREELARANAMQIGILQLLWPNHKVEVTAELSVPIQLGINDFGNNKFSDAKSYLTDEVIKTIVQQAEYLRARSLAARQDNIITEFMQAARKIGIVPELYPQKLIKINKENGEEVLIIPAVGVPQSLTYNHSHEIVASLNLSKEPIAYLLYDDINIRDKWVQHLDWLDKHLPIKGKKVIDTGQWLKDI